MLHGHVIGSRRPNISRRNATGQDLPIARGNVAPGLSSQMQSPTKGVRGHHLPKSHRRILIVGDSPGLCAALARSLRHPALRVRIAETGALGLAMLRREKIDFVIAELNLSPGGGIGFLETTRLEFPETTRVLITGECDIAVIRDAIRRSDVSFFLGKPWDAQSLRELVRNLLLVEWPIRAQEPVIAADFEAESRANSVSERLWPVSSPDLVCDSLARTRSRAEASFAQCETEGELAAVLGRAFARFVQPHQLWWWDQHQGILSRIHERSSAALSFDRNRLAPKLSRVLASINGASRPFVFGLNRMMANESVSSRNILAIPVVAGGRCLASVLVVAGQAQSVSGWPLDLAECLTDALGPTLQRIRQTALKRAKRCDRDRRIAERLRKTIAGVSRALASIEPRGQDDRSDCEAVQLIRSETLQLSNLAEELQGVVSSKGCEAA